MGLHDRTSVSSCSADRGGVAARCRRGVCRLVRVATSRAGVARQWRRDYPAQPFPGGARVVHLWPVFSRHPGTRGAELGVERVSTMNGNEPLLTSASPVPLRGAKAQPRGLVLVDGAQTLRPRIFYSAKKRTVTYGRTMF